MGIKVTSSVFYLEKFHQKIAGSTEGLLLSIVNSINSSPNKARILSDLKEEFPRFGKLMKLDSYRSHFKIEVSYYTVCF